MFEDEDDEEDEEDIEILYLWDCLADLFDLYRICKNYITNEFYTIDSAIILAIINDKKLPVTQTLEYFPYIHSGYVSMILPTRTEDNGERSNKDPSD